jgi:ATP-dependent Clp protease ATP-binding subunit ClpA
VGAGSANGRGAIILGAYTVEAERALELAADRARNFGHSRIGVEHLLVAMMSVAQEVDSPEGYRILRRCGVTLENLLDSLRERGWPHGGSVARAGASITPRMGNVLEQALQLSLELGHGRVRTGHLLLGALHEKGGIGDSVLTDGFGMTYEGVLEQVSEHTEARAELAKLGPAPPLPLSPVPTVRRTVAASRVGEMARWEAELDESYGGRVGTHHLLLALMMDEDSLAAKALRSFGLSYATLRARVSELNAYDSSDAPDRARRLCPEDDGPELGEPVEVSFGDLGVLLERLPQLLPPSTPLGWNTSSGDGSAFVAAGRGIDLRPYIRRALADAGRLA